MAYDSPENITSSLDIFEWVNSVTDSWFFPGAIFAVYIIILVKMLSNPANTSAKCFAAASFACMILSILIRITGLVSTGFMSIFILLTAGSAIWMHMENTGS